LAGYATANRADPVGKKLIRARLGWDRRDAHVMRLIEEVQGQSYEPDAESVISLVHST
jgi:hypothetical protein